MSAKEEKQPAPSGFFAVVGRGRETVDRWEKLAAARGGWESGWHAQNRGVVGSAG